MVAVELIVSLLPALLQDYGTWPRLPNATSERLARSCERAGTRRLALYSFRHVALTTSFRREGWRSEPPLAHWLFRRS